MGPLPSGVPRPLARSLVTLVVLATALAMAAPVRPAQAEAASAESAPAATLRQAADLAGGWLARQVTADGGASGEDPDTDVAPVAWTVLGMLASGHGSTSISRAGRGLVQRIDRRGVEDLSVSELALSALAFNAMGQVIPEPGGDSAPLVAELANRQQTGGVDVGLYGPSSPLAEPVTSQALTLLALASLDRTPSADALTWLLDQQCPSGGWPAYRDSASRSTDTCELLPAAMATTALASQALSAHGVASRRPAEGFLRAAATPTGAFASAPGLTATPLATAFGILAVRALTGQMPDQTWAGTSGTPQVVLRHEQLGCSWHGADRGAVASSAQPDQADGSAEEQQTSARAEGRPEPRQAAAATDVAVVAIAYADTSLPLAAGPPTVGDPFPNCPVTTERLAGASRTMTAVEASRRAFPTGSSSVVIATSSGYADALAAAAVAGASQAPLLLSGPDRMPAEVVDELVRLQADEVILMGGVAALREAVADQARSLEGVATVRRIAGPTRVETATAAAEEVGGDRAFLVRGSGPPGSAPWADALSVGGWAASRGIPVLLTEPERLPDATARALASRAEVIIIGGSAAISEAVAEQVSAAVPSTRRIAGPDRLATSAAIMRAAMTDGVDAQHLLLVTAAGFPDALAAGPAAAALGGNLLLVDPARTLEIEPTRQAILDQDYLVDGVAVIGGTASLPEEIGGQAAALVREGAAG